MSGNSLSVDPAKMPLRFEPYLARRAENFPRGDDTDWPASRSWPRFVVILPEEPARFKVGIVLIAVARAVPLNFAVRWDAGGNRENVFDASRMSLTIVEAD